MSKPEPTLCSRCGAAIYLMRGPQKDGRLTDYLSPIDALPNRLGDLVVNRERNLYRAATADEKLLQRVHGKNLFISHFSTCPHALGQRKRKRR